VSADDEPRPELLETLTAGATPADEDGAVIVPPPTTPLGVDRLFLSEKHTCPLGATLVAHRGLFYTWAGTHWVEVAGDDVRAALYRWLEGAEYWTTGTATKPPELVPFHPTRHKVADIVDALAGAEHVTADVEPPCWHGDDSPWGDDQVVAMRNGLLARSTRILYPHTPRLFNLHVLPFAYDPEARLAPRWDNFLDEVWGDDTETIKALQEVMGYILGGGTELQKLFGMIGPRRSGKGTILRVLTALLGRENVGGPTLSALATQFGLASLIGKQLAAISDARLGKQRDAFTGVERLLAISGEDMISVPRKFKDDWTGRLPTRFVLLSNELPAFDDASATIASRFILLIFRNSFYGRENTKLTEELLEELPSIFNWCLEGLDRLAERGKFVQPAASEASIRHLEDLASPVSAFIRDRCIRETDATVSKDDLWAVWKEWAEDAGIKKGTKEVLLRDLRAVDPGITSTRPTVGKKRIYMLAGIRLATPQDLKTDSQPTIQKTPDTPDRDAVPSALSRTGSGSKMAPIQGRSGVSGVKAIVGQVSNGVVVAGLTEDEVERLAEAARAAQEPEPAA
jgi:putative DNA primase/helicase